MSSMSVVVLFFFLLLSFQHAVECGFDYKDALTKSILYFETQRSGKLPQDQRIQWRGDSALKDGSDANVDLTGGYYDAGDNVKFGFPMAFTMTMLSWSVVEYGSKMNDKGELNNALKAIRWGTDYLLKATATQGVVYGEVGDGDSDHACWQRPEEMTTPRTSYKIDSANPGSDLAGETAAALAAAAIAFNQSDGAYSAQLLDRAAKVFAFARSSPGIYSNSISVAQNFYSSSGYNDEILWAAAWLYHATNDQQYLSILEDAGNSGNTGGTRTLFSWDDKFFGAEMLVAKLVFQGKVSDAEPWAIYKRNAENFLCNFIQKGDNNVKMSPGGMAWWQPWNNFQYTTSALLALVVYADGVSKASDPHLKCANDGAVAVDTLMSFATSQVDYILGNNPKQTSYMVGFGTNYPKQVHHRGASIVSIKEDPTPVDCKAGYDKWFNKNAPNPNVLVGALLGGPDADDAYTDSRSNFQQAEPPTVNTAPFVGVLARLS